MSCSAESATASVWLRNPMRTPKTRRGECSRLRFAAVPGDRSDTRPADQKFLLQTREHKKEVQTTSRIPASRAGYCPTPAAPAESPAAASAAQRYQTQPPSPPWNRSAIG